MPFKEVNYYKKKYRKILLDYRFVNNEIQMIDKNHNNVDQLKYKHNTDVFLLFQTITALFHSNQFSQFHHVQHYSYQILNLVNQ